MRMGRKRKRKSERGIAPPTAKDLTLYEIYSRVECGKSLTGNRHTFLSCSIMSQRHEAGASCGILLLG